MLNRFLNILFPEACPVCKKPSTNHKTAPICGDCWETIVPYKGAICQKCGKPLVSDLGITCHDCLKTEPAFKWSRGFGIYDRVLKNAINLFKYYGIKRLSVPLSKMLFTQLDNEHLTGIKTNPAPEKSWCGVKMPSVNAIIPIPLSAKRLRQRGFNQSALLSRHLANYIDAKLILNCLIKIRESLPQVGLSAKERKRNVKNTFGVVNKELIQGKSIILVDDVFTTGATIMECSKILKKAGSRDIYVVTLAHGRADI